jgi:hypothetical protein
MLHMLVNTHSPDHCGFLTNDEGAALRRGFEKFGELAKEKGATVQGTWVNTASHTIFVLIDAPSAHAVDEIIRSAELTTRTESRVYTLDEMQTLLKEIAA